MTTRITVRAEHAYDVVVGRGLRDEVGAAVGRRGRRPRDHEHGEAREANQHDRDVGRAGASYASQH